MLYVSVDVDVSVLVIHVLANVHIQGMCMLAQSNVKYHVHNKHVHHRQQQYQPHMYVPLCVHHLYTEKRIRIPSLAAAEGLDATRGEAG